MSTVEAFLAGLQHPRADDIRLLCSAVTTAFPDFTDEVKWNAPSYRLRMVSLVTLRILPPPNFQVILHAGAKKLTDPPDLRFPIDALRHRWADRTRCILDIDQASDIATTIDAVTRWRDALSANGLV